MLTGSLPRALEVRLERLHVREELSLVIHGAARVDASVAHRRLERRRGPQLERLGRLHIVVAVDEHRGRAGGRFAPFAENHGMARGGKDLGVETGGAEIVGHPLRGALHVGVVLGCAH